MSTYTNKLINTNQNINGCLIDTSILFAATYPLDPFNEWSENTLQTLIDQNIPLYTNQNIRQEFIDLNRRVLFWEILKDFYDDYTKQNHSLIPLDLHKKIKSFETRRTKAIHHNKTFKLSESEIKECRRLLECNNGYHSNAFDYFCLEGFKPRIETVWEDVVNEFKLNFIGNKEIESSSTQFKRPNWKGMMDVVGHTCIGSSDAMITNLFLNSEIKLILTADSDIIFALNKLKAHHKTILTPLQST